MSGSTTNSRDQKRRLPVSTYESPTQPSSSYNYDWAAASQRDSVVSTHGYHGGSNFTGSTTYYGGSQYTGSTTYSGGYDTPARGSYGSGYMEPAANSAGVVGAGEEPNPYAFSERPSSYLQPSSSYIPQRQVSTVSAMSSSSYYPTGSYTVSDIEEERASWEPGDEAQFDTSGPTTQGSSYAAGGTTSQDAGGKAKKKGKNDKKGKGGRCAIC